MLRELWWPRQNVGTNSVGCRAIATKSWMNPCSKGYAMHGVLCGNVRRALVYELFG